MIAELGKSKPHTIKITYLPFVLKAAQAHTLKCLWVTFTLFVFVSQKAFLSEIMKYNSVSQLRFFFEEFYESLS